MRNFIIVLVALFIVTSSVIGLYHDVSGSMDDTLLSGDAFVVLNFWYGVRPPFMNRPIVSLFKPRPDEIIVFQAPLDEHQILVKRIIATGGQTVAVVNKQVYVNGDPVPLPPGGKNADPVIMPAGDAGGGKRDFRPVATVPDSTVYVLGDNRDFSFDSRFWGFLPEQNIRGRVWFVLWSIDPAVPWSDIRHKIRWRRFFHLPR